MQLPDSFGTFLQEAAELLSRVEEIALDLQRDPLDRELVNELFRAFHTIKGSGAMFGFDEVAAFTHHIETALDKVRSGIVPVSSALVDLVLAARDEISVLLERAQGRSVTTGPVAEDPRDAIIAALAALSLAADSPASPPLGVSKSAVSESAGSEITTPQAAQRWHIRFQPDPGAMASGTNPALLFRELREMGPCTVTAHTDLVPALDTVDPERCYLWWDIDLETARDHNAIQDVFIFVEDGSDLTIESAVQQAIVPQPAPAPVAVAVSVTAPASAPVTAPPRDSAAAAKAASATDPVVRVPSGKLDRLVNLVGELVMNQSRLAQAAHGLDAPELSVPVEEIERLVSELRDTVLGIRMMPIGSTFGRFRRLVHDVSAELGKEIDLITEGAETEVDKSVLDQLGDPLVHLIRNSMDHGIEPVAERQRAGKPPRGRVTLSAAHEGSSVVVRIEDDGFGLDPAALRAKAIEKRLISSDAELSEKETFQLIFLPGFSTAKQVTNLSGRGVGMDVVKRGIEALRGSVAVSSVQGRGTIVALTLPLTLAIIDGLLVEIAGDRFILPMSAVTENVELHREERFRKNGRNVVAVRGELIPYIRLRELFGVDEGEPAIEKIVITRHEDQRVGLVVDRVFGSHQTVIQSMGRFYKNVPLFSGATIMGDGRVALIMDVPSIVHHAGKQCQPGSASPSVLMPEYKVQNEMRI